MKLLTIIVIVIVIVIVIIITFIVTIIVRLRSDPDLTLMFSPKVARICGRLN